MIVPIVRQTVDRFKTLRYNLGIAMADQTSKIRYNEDFTEYSIVFPDGTETDACELPESGIEFHEHEDTDELLVAVLLNFDDEDSALEKNRIYRLTPMETEVEEGVEFEDEEADEEEGEGAEEVPEP